MSIIQYLQEALLNEITADEKFNKFYDGKIDRDTFDKAVDTDPTSKGDNKVGDYVDWLLLNPDAINDDTTSLLQTFHRLKTKLDPADRDINKMDYKKFVSVMKDAEESGVLLSKKDRAKAREQKAFKESEIVYKDDDFIVISPKTKEASQFMGKGSAWCTAYQDDRCMFDHYGENGDLYIIRNNKTKEMWQMFKPNGAGRSPEYKTFNNSPFDPWKVFAGTDLLKWIDENEFPEEAGLDAIMSNVAEYHKDHFGGNDALQNQVAAELRDHLNYKLEMFIDYYGELEDYLEQHLEVSEGDEDYNDEVERITEEYNDTAARFLNEEASTILDSAEGILDEMKSNHLIDIENPSVITSAISVAGYDVDLSEVLDNNPDFLADQPRLFDADSTIHDILDTIYSTEHKYGDADEGADVIRAWYTAHSNDIDDSIDDIIYAFGDLLSKITNLRGVPGDDIEEFLNGLEDDLQKIKIKNDDSETRDENPQLRMSDI